MISLTDFLNVYTLFACVVVLLWWYSTSTFDFWKKLNVKYKEPIPFVGNTANSLLKGQSFQELLAELYGYFGNEPYGGYYVMREPTLLVKDPDLVRRILVTDFKYFVDRGLDNLLYVDRELNPLAGHLFFANGNRWRVLRQRLSPVFTSGKLKLMYQEIYECIAMMNEFVLTDMTDDGKDVDVKELFQRLTIDVIGTCAFGLECNSLKSNDEFRKYGAEIFKPTWFNALRVFVASFSQNLLKLFRMPELKREVSQFFINMVQSTLAYRKKNDISRNDFLQMLMELQNTSLDPRHAFYKKQKNILEDEEFDELDITANTFFFFIAGFETTASTLSYCVYELALNKQIQDKLRTEVQQVQTADHTINPNNLKKLTYMDAVISETLRKYPVVVVLSRKCNMDYQIPNTNVKLPAGTKLTIPVWSIQHDSKFYPKPDVFDPDRFNSEDNNIISGSYIPFGDGPRMCLGKRFAEMEIKATLADIILKYEFALSTKTEVPLIFKGNPFRPFLSPKCGVWINVSKVKM